jgi:hypothetical protein
MKYVVFTCLVCALVALSECQDLTSLMFQAMGMDAPPMPPIMPMSLREHLYPGQLQQEFLRRKQQELQKQRYLAYVSAQQRRQGKDNPYSAPYKTNTKVLQPRSNSVYSPANMIRQPGTANVATYSKRNPYSTSYQNVAVSKGGAGNPYSVSRASSSSLPFVRSRALPLPSQARGMLKTMRAMKVMRDQPRRITDAKAAGCKLPADSAAASLLLFSNCKNPTARMVCQTEMMTCMNVGMTPMCCPVGMNRLAMDTISYMNKLQHFMSEIA